MRANQFTQSAQSALRLAQGTAGELGHSYVGSEHILLGILSSEDSIARRCLREQGVSAEKARQALISFVGKGLSGMPPSQGLTPRARRVIEAAAQECADSGSVCVGTEHLLLGLLHEEDSMAMRILRSMGTDVRRLQVCLIQRMGVTPYPRTGPRVPRDAPPRPAPAREEPVRSKALEQFTRSLNALAREGKLDPVVGREREITRTIRILSRRTKNNPVLIGEPGVGKTAVAEALAQRIVNGDVPPELQNTVILSIDIASMLAGTKYRGEFEERVKNALAEVQKLENVVLFIDELHTIVGAGSAEGAVDAANILKPALGRGQIRLIGATTLDEYRKHIEKDAALERRFQTVTVDEPDDDTALEILEGLKSRYEAHHRLTISSDALRAAVELGRRYLPDRRLPDKAIDLIDEACSRVRLGAAEKTPEAVLLEQRLMQVRADKAAAVAGENFASAAKLKDVEDDFARQLRAQHQCAPCAVMDTTVTAEDIAAVTAEWTGIPVQRITCTERERLAHLEDELRKGVIGQDEAVGAIARAIRRSRMGLKEPNRPVGCFLLLGESGVGKTQLCRTLACTLFGSEDAMIRLDMSEFSERHSTSRLVGAPPGYVGHDDGGQLTERVRRRPYSVVLFDEIEKAHPDVWNLLLQIMEDGRLTDSHGRRVDFQNTVIVMTGNVGAQHLAKNKAALGFACAPQDAHTQRRQAVEEELRRTFRPEFLGRLDETIIFRRLTEDDLAAIAEKMIEELSHRLSVHGITLTAEPSALAFLADKAQNESYGARPLRRMLRTMVEDVIADGLITGRCQHGDALVLTQQGENLCIEHAKKAEPN